MVGDFLKVRAEFPITTNKIFLNHAAYSPLPKKAVAAMREYNEVLCRYDLDSLQCSLGKEVFAELINAKEDEIALIQNTSTGLNIVANMLSYPRGSNIVTTDLEYPSVVYPWLKQRFDLEVRYAKSIDGVVSSEEIERLVDNKTILVAVSHVEYVNGFRHNLKKLAEISHDHGAFLVVDAIQSLGAITVDVKESDVDFLAASCYKWLLGPAGAGYLYVRKGLIEEFEPPFIGWASVKPEVFETIDFWEINELQLSESASRFEVGSPSFISFVGANAAIRLLLEMNIDTIQKRVLSLTDMLIDSLKNSGFNLTTPEETEHRSGIIHVTTDRAEDKAKRLARKQIIISARSHGLRVSPHFYNSEEEIDHFIRELTAL